MRYKMSKGNIAEKLENAMLEIERLEKLVDEKSAAVQVAAAPVDHKAVYAGISDSLKRAQYRQNFAKELGLNKGGR